MSNDQLSILRPFSWPLTKHADNQQKKKNELPTAVASMY